MALRKVGKILLYGGAGILVLILLLMLAVKLALDRAPKYQAEIKEWVHEQIGYRIAFAQVWPAFRWYGPELYFDRLELRSKDNRRVLARAAGGRIAADVWQLIRSGKLLAGRIEVDSPNFHITRTGPKRFALASEITLGGDDSAWSRVRLDDLPAITLTIRRGFLTIQNWNSELPTLELRDVNLDLRRADGVATLAVAARLPPVLGGDVNVDGTARGHGLLDTVKWTTIANTRNLSLAGWRQLLPEYLVRLSSGTGGFEMAARGQGTMLTRADLDFSATDVITQLADEPSVKFDQVTGALTITHSGDFWTLLGRRVQALRAGRRDPDSQFDVSWRGGDAGLLELRAHASYLRAETLLPLAGLLPQKDLRERLQEIAPTGEWMDTHVDLVRTAVGDPWRLDTQARFRGVGFASAGRAPGLRGLSGTLAGTDSGGRIDIDTQSGVFAWPTQLAQPIDLVNFKTTLFWKRTADELLVATPSINLRTHDANLQGRAAWHQPADASSPMLAMVMSVDNGNVAQVHRYFPRALLHPRVFAWLNRAFVAGHLSHADIIMQGPVRHFPFRDGSGVFVTRGHVDGLTLDYREGWPRAENLAVSAEFRNEGLSLQLQSGQVGSIKLDKGDARFADFKTAELRLHGTASGDAADALDFLRATPLDAMAEKAFSQVDARGPMQSEVDLYLPFKEFDQRRILVHAHLHGVSLSRLSGTLAATELHGDADMDGAQVSYADVHGKVLGGPFQMQARSPRDRPPTHTSLTFSGTLSGDALHAALSLPANMPINGATDWRGVLRMAAGPARERSLRLSGNLAGLEFNLPEPLAKPAGRPLPSSVEMQWPPTGGAQVRVALGTLLHGQMTLEPSANGPILGRAAVTFGSAPAAEPPGFSDTQVLNTGGKIERLDLAGWLKLYTPDKTSRPLANYLRSATFDVARIDYLGMSFFDVSLDLNLTDSGWHIGVGGPNVTGAIFIPSAVGSSEPWKLEFKHLKFVDEARSTDADAKAAVDSAPDGKVAARLSGANPRRIPAIEFHASDMTWDERQLGEVRATLVRLDDGIGLKQLTLTGVNFSATATGEWRGRDLSVGRVAGSLSSTDLGGTLKQLGYDPVIEAKTGKIEFDMRWMGAPTMDAFEDATGHMRVALDKGQITGIKPGAGRVVGLASVAALPRRLALDFSDLTDKGMAFDTVRGDFELHDGSAFTDNVLLKGPAAEIGLIGRVGLKNKDYDQTAVVTGNVSSSLPLAAFAGGPILGAAVLVFTQVFKQPLKGLARGYYRITGDWDNPTVERIKSADAAATAEAPK